MARLASSGFELNTVSAGVEFGISGAPTISATTFRSGAFAGRISSLTTITEMSFQQTFAAANGNGPFFGRVYLNIAVLPSANNDIIGFYTSAGVLTASIALSSTGTLILRNGVATAVGSASAALSTGTWYRIEFLFNNVGGAGAGILTALLDGVQFASSSTLTIASGVNKMRIGGNLNVEAQTTGDWFFDDWAINDSTVGGNQTNYPGIGKIIHLHPNAAGDANTFATQTGGTAGSANNFTRVKEVTPDDATTLNGSNTLNQEDLMKCGASGLGATDDINVVAVGGRFRNNIADATTTAKLEIEKAALGTKTQSAAITPNTTSWNTNQTAAPFSVYPITLYQDPDGTAWSQATLDTMQIGYKLTTGGTNRVEFSTIWALVEYVPVVTPAGYAAWGNDGISQPLQSSFMTIVSV